VSAHLYYADDCTLTVPAGFRDRTTNLLEWKTPEGDSIALAIQREPLPARPPEEALPPAAVLQQYVDEQTRTYPTQFAGFRLERDEVAAGDGGGFEMRRKAFRWKNGEDVLYHHQAFVIIGERILVLTAAAKARHRNAVDHLVEEALNDLRVRGD
jgi:hypothetical protein